MPETTGHTILIIDDEQAIRQSFGDYLEDRDYGVRMAENGRMGLEAFMAEPADLVMVDLRMPEMDGLTVLSRIRELSPDTPMIAISGTGVISEAVEALHRGAWDYLIKPIDDLAILEHAVSNTLEKARLKRENQAYQEHLEALVAERTGALRRSEARFREILDAIPTVIIIADAQSREMVYANPTASRMLGLAGDSLIGASLDDLRGRAEGDPTCSPGPDQDLVECEGTLKSRDGGEIPVFQTVSRTSLQGKPCIMICLTDLTKQKQAEAEKVQLEKQLRQAQKMEALGTLSGGISHDFNNILGAIIGYAELGCLTCPDDSHGTRDKFSAILKAGERARELVSRILSFSRMQENIFTPVQIGPIVKEALKLLSPSLPANIRVVHHLPADDAVMADPTQIHQVIMNLFTNAFHAMEERGGILTVHLDTGAPDGGTPLSGTDPPADGYVRLRVSDTGSGIPAAHLERIFDPYFTTKSKQKGTGLGLSVVHGIVRSHGGVIHVNSEPGQGATFTVFLPVTRISPGLPKIEITGLPRGQERILLVEDEPDLLGIGRQMLETLGYRVTADADATRALTRFRRSPHRFDLVVTDLDMPMLTGDRLAREMLRIRSDIPVILCTGFAERFDHQRAAHIGIRHLLTKPIKMEVLARTIREVLA